MPVEQTTDRGSALAVAVGRRCARAGQTALAVAAPDEIQRTSDRRTREHAPRWAPRFSALKGGSSGHGEGGSPSAPRNGYALRFALWLPGEPCRPCLHPRLHRLQQEAAVPLGDPHGPRKRPGLDHAPKGRPGHPDHLDHLLRPYELHRPPPFPWRPTLRVTVQAERRLPVQCVSAQVLAPQRSASDNASCW
jgi:hypothetical protein